MERKFVIIDSQDLTNCLRDLIRNELKEIKQSNSFENKPLTVKATIELFDITRPCLYDWLKKGIIKGHKIGGRRYFFLSEIIDQLNAKRHGKSRK